MESTLAVSTIRNIITIAALELQRVFVTRRGLLLVLATLLVWALVLRYLIYNAAVWLADGSTGRAIGSIFNSRLIESLLTWRVAEFSVYWVVALYIFPIFCLTIAADQTASDRTRGTLRLLSLHTTRSSLLFGRFTGLMLVQALLVAITILATLGLALFRDPALLPYALDTALMVFVNVMLLLGAYTAAMALISLFAGSARQATTWAIILWIVLTALTSWIARYYPDAAVLKWFIPGAHISTLLQLNDWQTLQLAPIPILQAAMLLGIGYGLMQRRDL